MTLILSTSLFMTSCKTRVVVIPADRVIRFDGTNYIVPKAVMLDILHKLNATNL